MRLQLPTSSGPRCRAQRELGWGACKVSFMSFRTSFIQQACGDNPPRTGLAYGGSSRKASLVTLVQPMGIMFASPPRRGSSRLTSSLLFPRIAPTHWLEEDAAPMGLRDRPPTFGEQSVFLSQALVYAHPHRNAPTLRWLKCFPAVNEHLFRAYSVPFTESVSRRSRAITPIISQFPDPSTQVR